MSEAEFQRERLTTPSGADLALYLYPAQGEARGIVHINHGLAEYAGRYAPFAAYLSSRGYHVIGQDHRGHGETRAADGAPRRFADHNGWSKLMSDINAVEDHARSLWGNLPLVIFGHSMGAVIAMNHVMQQSDQLAGAAIWNGNMALGGNKLLMRIVLFFEALVGGRYTESRTIDNLTFKAWNKRFPERRSDADWLSRDAIEVKKYVDNPICGWPSTVSLWRDFLQGIDFAEDDRNFKTIRRSLPFNLIGGGQDPATNNGKAVKHLEKRLKRAKFTDIRCEILKDYRHETLNEVGRDKRMAEFADWLDQITS